MRALDDCDGKRRPVLAKAVGCGWLSTRGDWRSPDAGGVISPLCELLRGPCVLLEGVELRAGAGEFRAADRLLNEPELLLRQLPQAAARGPTACATLGVAD